MDNDRPRDGRVPDSELLTELLVTRRRIVGADVIGVLARFARCQLGGQEPRTGCRPNSPSVSGSQRVGTQTALGYTA
jgi:hypothetical protein